MASLLGRAQLRGSLTRKDPRVGEDLGRGLDQPLEDRGVAREAWAGPTPKAGRVAGTPDIRVSRTPRRFQPRTRGGR